MKIEGDGHLTFEKWPLTFMDNNNVAETGIY
jgi:hypothetical protein